MHSSYVITDPKGDILVDCGKALQRGPQKINEAANIGQIPNLEKLVVTIRSREISACLVL